MTCPACGHKMTESKSQFELNTTLFVCRNCGQLRRARKFPFQQVPRFWINTIEKWNSDGWEQKSKLGDYPELTTQLLEAEVEARGK